MSWCANAGRARTRCTESSLSLTRRLRRTLDSSRKTPTGQGFSPSPASTDALTTELDQLERLELGELRVHYRNRSGRIAPARISRALLLHVLAYRIQLDAF